MRGVRQLWLHRLARPPPPGAESILGCGIPQKAIGAVPAAPTMSTTLASQPWSLRQAPAEVEKLHPTGAEHRAGPGASGNHGLGTSPSHIFPLPVN